MGNDVSKLSSRAVSVIHEFDLMDEIGAPEDYLELFDALRSASKEDVINIHINTPGGDLSTVAQIIHNIYTTEAKVVTIAEGQVFSGGSLVFFAGHELVVGQFSEFLAHSPHGYERGKVNDRVDAGKHLSDYTKGFYEEIYTPFYSKAEIRAILRGKEHYETSEQMQKRLMKAGEAIED